MLKKDPFLRIRHAKSGQTPYELRSPDHFVGGNGFAFKLALRGQETISGPRSHEAKEYLKAYLEVLEETIKYYSDVNRKHEREKGLEAKYPEGLHIYEKPNSSNQELKKAYDELWRDIDALPGGTAGVLLHEARTGGELTHLQKAQNRLKSLQGLSKSSEILLSEDDKKTLRLVMIDLISAIGEALCVNHGEPDLDQSFDENDLSDGGSDLEN